MTATIIAVIGTLLGSVTAYLLQQRAARTERAESRAAQRGRDQLGAITDLLAALADHRRAMWVREDLRLTGGAEQQYAAARADSHVSRSAITGPLARVAILAPALTDVANAAAQAAYALRKAPDCEALDARRAAAIAAADRLLAAATALF
ncbi:protein kilB [Streptomyces sp. IBSBF 2435]|uniref:protein kilB n=1 Tax=Streptomyces sp. IBSBF 2435 TaxID=2903531 RepID=UPI002FDBE6CC